MMRRRQHLSPRLLLLILLPRVAQPMIMSSSSSSSSSSFSSSAETLKTSILRRVSTTREDADPSTRAAILDEIRQLEALNPSPDPIDQWGSRLDGQWSLIGTYPDDGSSSSSSSSSGDGASFSPQALLDLTYETLYKSARWNWLAGGIASRREQRSTGARSFQNLDLASNTIYNVVDFNAPGGGRACISVRGEINREDSATLGVCFTESKITLKDAPKVFGIKAPELTVPLPRPRGTVTTTYLDDDMRISRGSRNNIFLTVRPRGGGGGGGGGAT